MAAMERWQAYAISLGLHLALGVLVIAAGLRWDRPVTPITPTLAIEAVVMSRSPPVTPPPLVQPEPAPAPQASDTAAETAARERREAAAQAEAERRREAQQKRIVEERRLAEEKRRAEAQRQAEEKRRQAQARQEQARQEEARQEEARRAEVRRAEARRRAEIDAQLKAAREQELARQREVERQQQAGRRAQQSAEWAAAIQSKVERAWIRPPSTATGLDCLVAVSQVPGGVVVGVELKSCNGDAVVRQSIEAAVFRASPLPPPPDPALFERTIELRFRPRD